MTDHEGILISESDDTVLDFVPKTSPYHKSIHRYIDCQQFRSEPMLCANVLFQEKRLDSQFDIDNQLAGQLHQVRMSMDDHVDKLPQLHSPIRHVVRLRPLTLYCCQRFI